MSSQVFLGPTPIIEKSWSPPLRLATPLLETAAGMAGILDASAASMMAAQSARTRKLHSFFIEEMLRLRIDDGKEYTFQSISPWRTAWMKSVEAGVWPLAHLAGDLSAMVGRMHQDVSQNVLHGVCPRLSFGVLVRNHLGKERRRKTLEVFSPQPAKLCRMGFALREIELGPDRKTLCLLRQSFQPEPLGRTYVRHELQFPLVFTLATPHSQKHFALPPCFINKLTTPTFHPLHPRPPS